MKAKSSLLLAVSLLASTLSAQAQNTTIDLDVSGLPDGTQVALSVAATHSDEPAIQTAAVQAGKAYFAFDTEEPRLYSLHIEQPWGNIEVMANKGDHVKIHANAHKEHYQRGDYYRFEPVQVRDSYLHSQLLEKTSIRKGMDAAYDKYHQANKDILDKLRAAYDRKDKAAEDSLRTTDAYKKLEADEKAFFESVRKSYNDLYLANRDSWWGPFLVLHTMNWIAPDMQSVYDQFSTEAKESFYGKVLKAKLDEKANPAAGTLGVGAKVPDFTFTDHATGQPTSLYAQLAGKRYLLFDVWASWCGPCRREIPNFKAMYEKYKDAGFTVVSISADEDNAAWLKALDEEKLPWANGRDTDKAIGKLYNVQYYPTVYLVDANGIVVAKDNDARGEKLQTKLAELMK